MRMARTVVSLILAMTVSSCGEMSAREKLVKQIEDAVVLPADAADMDSYSRYYTMRTDGSVLATYLIHMPGYREAVAEACRESEGDWFPCPNEGGEVRLAEAGESTWVGDPLDIPAISDGGCRQVTIEYLPEEARFLRVACNGGL